MVELKKDKKSTTWLLSKTDSEGFHRQLHLTEKDFDILVEKWTKVRLRMGIRVNTIYPAFMGEVNCYGIGVPCTFVRLAGCNLRCYFKTKGTLCDTPEALDVSSGTEMTAEEIAEQVQKLGNKIICLTGGEPLCQNVHGLLEILSRKNYQVVVETNGSRSIEEYRCYKNVSFVVDCKSASSGEHKKMLEENWPLLDKKDYVKFVIDSWDDYVEAKVWLGSHLGSFKGSLAFGLFWGSEITYQELMAKIIKDRIPVTLNMQTHKMACLYDRYKDSLEGISIPRSI